MKNLVRLTPREFEVAMLIVQRGENAKQIGERLGITWQTVQMHTKNIYSKVPEINRATFWKLFIIPEYEHYLPQGYFQGDLF